MNRQYFMLVESLTVAENVAIGRPYSRGLLTDSDIGATEYVHLRLLEQREEGTATLLISEDLDEIMSLADRIAVLFEGEVMGVLNQFDATPEKLGLLMAGVVD